MSRNRLEPQFGRPTRTGEIAEDIQNAPANPASWICNGSGNAYTAIVTGRQTVQFETSIAAQCPNTNSDTPRRKSIT